MANAWDILSGVSTSEGDAYSRLISIEENGSTIPGLPNDEYIFSLEISEVSGSISSDSITGAITEDQITGDLHEVSFTFTAEG